MRRFILTLVATGTILATAAIPAAGQLPPLIDREVFFGDPEIAGAQVSPDGRFLSFHRPYAGQLNVWVAPVGEPFANGGSACSKGWMRA